MRARRRFGQHFLEPAWVAKLVNAVAPAADDRVIEIGPGRGAVTASLAARVGQLVAIEVDRDLASSLTLRALPNVTVIEADVLSIDLSDLAGRLLAADADHPVRVVGNLPYNISTPILFRLLGAGRTGTFRDATLMLQQEVADRLVAKPGTGDYGVLTLTTALHADVSRLLELPPGAFRPAPKVRSSVVRLTFRPPPPEVHDAELVQDVVRAMFTQRRKMLSNALASFAEGRGISAASALSAAGVDPRRRPETLTLDEVARLAAAFAR